MRGKTPWWGRSNQGKYLLQAGLSSPPFAFIPDTPCTGSVSLVFPETPLLHGKWCTPGWNSLFKMVIIGK